MEDTPIDAINRVRPPELQYRSQEDLVREWVAVAGAVSTFAVQMLRVLPVFTVTVALLLGLSIQGAAADIRQGKEVDVTPNETVNDDVYAFGGTVNIQGTVSGSVILFGSTTTISGHVSRDVIAGGGTLIVTGQVDGSIRAAGGTIILSGPVGEDVVVGGGTVNVNSGATIGRDLIVGSGMATVAGPVTRRVLAGAGTLTLQSKVGGNVTGQVDHLQLDAGAQIGGNLDYTSNNEVVKASGASVAGTTTRHAARNGGLRGPGAVFLDWLRTLIGFFALGLLLVLLAPSFSLRTAEILQRSPWASLAIGAAVLVLTPILALIVFILGLLIGGWWIGLLLLPVYLLALALAYTVSGYFVGRLVSTRLGWSRLHAAWVLLGGLFVLTLVGLIPVLGALVGLAAALFGLGTLSMAVASQRSRGRVSGLTE
jgi:cytoskeletal protein CcmA (bactofilin family)